MLCATFVQDRTQAAQQCLRTMSYIVGVWYGLCRQDYCSGRGSSHCISWQQTQPILTTCHVRYHTILWDNRSTGLL